MKTDERSLRETDGDGESARPKKRRHPALTFLGELPGLILMAFALALLIKSTLLQAFWIPTGSMEPTLVRGDRVIVAKVPYYFHDPQRGDVIVFEEPIRRRSGARRVVCDHPLARQGLDSPPVTPTTSSGDRRTGDVVSARNGDST